MAESSSQSSSTSPSAPTQTFTPSDRIAELNDIDRSVATLLASASEAVGILSNSSSTSTKPSLPSAQTAFQNAASTYFSTLSAIEVRLRRQVYALEEAGLIEPGNERDTRRGRVIGSDNSTQAGGGPLDTSWLNARANNKVGDGMKKELMAEAREFVERTTGKKLISGTKVAGSSGENEEMDMT